VKAHKHTGLATGPLLPGLFVPAVEGNTWVGFGPTKSPEGVWVTSKTAREHLHFHPVLSAQRCSFS